jgi:hypothetical protein
MIPDVTGILRPDHYQRSKQSQTFLELGRIMQFVANGPEIPDALLRAHEEGRVVFFCGAGISYQFQPHFSARGGTLQTSNFQLPSPVATNSQKQSLEWIGISAWPSTPVDAGGSWGRNNGKSFATK